MPKLSVKLLGYVSDDELADLYRDCSLYVFPSLHEGFGLPVLEAMSCGLPVVGTLQDNFDIPGFELCVRDVDDIVNKTSKILNDYDDYSQKARQFAIERDWDNIFDELEQYYYEAKELKHTVPFNMKDRLLFSYNNTELSNMDKNYFSVELSGSPYLQIRGNNHKKYKVIFMDNDSGFVHYQDEVPAGGWVSCNIDYYVNWKIQAINIETQEIEWEYIQDLKDKDVLVWLDSKALGDTLAWTPVVEAFRKKHKCKMYCSTYLNDLVRESYPEITFVEPITNKDFEFTYRIGFFEISKESPVDMRDVSLQGLCAGILGMTDYQETKCNIIVREKETEIQQPYVCIGTQSTAQAKYWNYDGGWDKVVDFLVKKGYNVVCIDKHASFGNDKYFNYAPKNAIGRHERTLDQTIATLNGAEFFIGLGSGLSWLAWSLNKNVILISGFSNPNSEFVSNCIRLHDDKGCNSCYNRHKFDPGDWLWCPDHKGTDRMFECTKNITPKKVYNAINKVITLTSKND